MKSVTAILCWCVLFPIPSFQSKIRNSFLSNGHTSCPCLSYSDLPDVDADFFSSPRFGGTFINITNYGLGCVPHDVDSEICKREREKCHAVIPKPPDCDMTWCSRSWCFVDGYSCELDKSVSTLYKGTYESYATCGQMDSFSGMQRIKSLKGRTFRAAFNSNSGGYTGAYNPNGQFAVDNNWHGPLVQFIQKAAINGGFKINITQPPHFLLEESQNYFRSESTFDYCVYAVALGFLDFCVAAYTMTDLRVASSTFFQTHEQPLFLITVTEENDSSFEQFYKSCAMLFKPFDRKVWALILLFVIPFMGLITVIHEYGAPGSAYSKTKQIMVNKKKKKVRRIRQSVLHHMFASYYRNLLGLTQSATSENVVTLGGKINLLGYSFFVLAVIAVYTANLAAILTQKATVRNVNSIESAMLAGYTFCAERQTAKILKGIYDIEHRLIVDPVEMGGDGKPGFACEKCEPRIRAIDFISRTNKDKKIYCDAAIALEEDIVALQTGGNHCNKSIVGGPIVFVPEGIPMFNGVSEELKSFLYQEKNDNKLKKLISDAKPSNSCSVTSDQDISLTIFQMGGVWVVTFFCAFVGLMTKIITAILNTNPRRSKELSVYDQWGNETGHEISFGSVNYNPGNHSIRRMRSIYGGGKRDSASVLSPDNPETPHQARMQSNGSGRQDSASVFNQDDPETPHQARMQSRQDSASVFNQDDPETSHQAVSKCLSANIHNEKVPDCTGHTKGTDGHEEIIPSFGGIQFNAESFGDVDDSLKKWIWGDR